MRFIGNVLWFCLGGLILGLLWFVAGLLCCVTIIGIPLAVPCFRLAGFSMWPFGRTTVNNGSACGFLLNVLWVLLLGWELALIHVAIGALWCVTIVGIPFGVQCFKLARLALMPYGAQIVRT